MQGAVPFGLVGIGAATTAKVGKAVSPGARTAGTIVYIMFRYGK